MLYSELPYLYLQGFSLANVFKKGLYTNEFVLVN